MLNNKGFTLIEIMAVIAILAILIAGAGLAVTSVINRQKIRVQNEKVEIIKDAAIAYVQNKKFFIPSCVHTDNSTTPPTKTYKTITDAQVESLNQKLEETAYKSIRNNFSSLNSNTAIANYFKGVIGVDNEKCYKLISVQTLYEEGFIEKGQECYTGTRSTYSTIVVYSQGDVNNPEGTLVAVPAKHFCY